MGFWYIAQRYLGSVLKVYPPHDLKVIKQLRRQENSVTSELLFSLSASWLETYTFLIVFLVSHNDC